LLLSTTALAQTRSRTTRRGAPPENCAQRLTLKQNSRRDQNSRTNQEPDPVRLSEGGSQSIEQVDEAAKKTKLTDCSAAERAEQSDGKNSCKRARRPGSTGILFSQHARFEAITGLWLDRHRAPPPRRLAAAGRFDQQDERCWES